MAVSDELAIVELSVADIEDGLKLSDEAGWNQTADDWRLFIQKGRTIGVRDANGSLIATAAALPYERDFGYVAMVLVTASARRQGLATRLVDRCVERIRQWGLVPMLDATPAGEAVYRQQGFEAMFGLERWQGKLAGPPSYTLPAGVREACDDDIDLVAALDAEAVGARRREVLGDFVRRAGSRVLVTNEKSGFALVRQGRRALQLGPLVAGTPAEALRLLAAALGAARGVVFMDVPVLWKEIGEWLAARGFVRQRSFARMALGRSVPFGEPRRLFAVAGPEFG